MLRRYAVLQALAGQKAEALDTMARLKIFATQLHDWPKQLLAVYDLADEAGKPLASFKADLVKLYGVPLPNQEPSEDEEEE